MPNETSTPNERIRKHYERTRLSKKKMMLTAIAGAVMIAALILVLLATFAFRIENVSIEGDCVYAADALSNAGGFSVGDPLCFVNGKKVARGIVQGLAYVESVTVKKKLPNTLVLQIRSAYDSFAVNMGSAGYVIFSAGGKIVSGGRLSLPEGCAEVVGLDSVNTQQGQQICAENSEKFELFRVFITGCAKEGLVDFTKIDIGDPYNITAIYKNRIKLIFGGIAKISLKAAGAAEIIERDYSLDDAQYAEINISDPDRAYGKNVSPPVTQDGAADPFAAAVPASGEQTQQGDADGGSYISADG
ncbi:MAG: FtsQ-type POTRA domain-containing protein [Clostridia bacterium]|nr:FtsQ-type POTRA domain-containing protein [Clostridia bacterium]